MSSHPAGFTVSRSRWWTASGATPRAVAQWYDAHPTPGFVSDGGLGSSSGTGSPTIEFVSFHETGAPDEVVTPVGVRIESTQGLLRLIFPGFFDDKIFHSSELQAETALLLDTVAGRLEDEIYKSLRCSDCGARDVRHAMIRLCEPGCPRQRG